MSSNAETDSLLRRLADGEKSYIWPSRLRELASTFIGECLALLFPHFEREATVHRSAPEHLDVLSAILDEAVTPLLKEGRSCSETKTRFLDSLESLYDLMLEDARALAATDPAAESVDEVILAYPGFLALAIHRIAHHFYECEVPIWPRLLAEHAHRHTGIDIHPGARIGRRCSIDHGTGIVIGETAVIGEDVRLYQGVTLGALAVEKKLLGTKRHPTLGHRVVVYAGATILGGETFVGDESVVGGNVWLTSSVPAGSIVTLAGSRVRQGKGTVEAELEFVI